MLVRVIPSLGLPSGLPVLADITPRDRVLILWDAADTPPGLTPHDVSTVLASRMERVFQALHPRSWPTAEPWGPVIYLPVDMPLDHIQPPRVSPCGVVVPIPRDLYLPRIYRGLATISTALMRWFYRPNNPLGG